MQWVNLLGNFLKSTVAPSLLGNDDHKLCQAERQSDTLPTQPHLQSSPPSSTIMLLTPSFSWASLQKRRQRERNPPVESATVWTKATIPIDLTHCLEEDGGHLIPLTVFLQFQGTVCSALLLQVIKWVEFVTMQWQVAMNLSKTKRMVG